MDLAGRAGSPPGTLPSTDSVLANVALSLDPYQLLLLRQELPVRAGGAAADPEPGRHGADFPRPDRRRVDATRAMLARRIARNMVVLMVGAMLVGSYVLDIFGISLPIVRVGGGLLLAANAWRLLHTNHSANDSRSALAEAFTPEHARRQAFYPLTFPISCGPASIAAAITVGVTLHDARVPLSLAASAAACWRCASSAA